MWRSMASVNLMLPKEERKAMLLRIYNDDTPLIDHSQQKRLNKEAQAATRADSDMPDAAASDDDEGGVKLGVDEDEAVLEGAMGTEEDVQAKEDRLLADHAQAADEQRTVDAAPEREGESDSLNTTI